MHAHPAPKATSAFVRSLSHYDDRTFAASAPRLWNALPRELKIATSLIYFKRLLKTHLFRIAYEQ